MNENDEKSEKLRQCWLYTSRDVLIFFFIIKSWNKLDFEGSPIIVYKYTYIIKVFTLREKQILLVYVKRKKKISRLLTGYLFLFE